MADGIQNETAEALTPVTPELKSTFISELRSVVQPYLGLTGRRVTLVTIQFGADGVPEIDDVHLMSGSAIAADEDMLYILCPLIAPPTDDVENQLP